MTQHKVCTKTSNGSVHGEYCGDECWRCLRVALYAYRADVEPVLRAVARWHEIGSGEWSFDDGMAASRVLFDAVTASRVCREIKEGK